MKRILVPLATMLALVAWPMTADAAKPVKTIQFSTDAFAANETDVGGIVTLTRSWSTATASVLFSTVSGGTATAGSDYYTTTDLILNFARGVTQVNVQVNLLDDGVFDESPETVNLALSSPSRGAVLGSQSTATLTITDTDPPAGPTIAAFPGTATGQIDLSWAAVPGATDYTLYRGTSSGVYTAGPQSTFGTNSFTDGGLTIGVTYYYVAYAVGAFGTSAVSNEAFAVPNGTS